MKHYYIISVSSNDSIKYVCCSDSKNIFSFSCDQKDAWKFLDYRDARILERKVLTDYCEPNSSISCSFDTHILEIEPTDPENYKIREVLEVE